MDGRLQELKRAMEAEPDNRGLEQAYWNARFRIDPVKPSVSFSYEEILHFIARAEDLCFIGFSVPYGETCISCLYESARVIIDEFHTLIESSNVLEIPWEDKLPSQVRTEYYSNKILTRVHQKFKSFWLPTYFRSYGFYWPGPKDIDLSNVPGVTIETEEEFRDRHISNTRNRFEI